MIKSGCGKYGDCFTCPFSDCVAGDKEIERGQSAYKCTKEYKAQKQRQYRRKKLMQEFPFLDWGA